MAVCVTSALAQSSGLNSEDQMVEQARADMAKRNLTLTAENEMALRLRWRQMQMLQNVLSGAGARPGGAMPVMPSLPMPMPAPAPGHQPAPMTGTELQTQLAGLPAPAPVETVSRQDGFELNGVPVLDAEGRIRKHVVNPMTGDFTYAIERADGSQIIKRGRGPRSTPFPIATVNGQAGRWVIRTADGQNSEGDIYALSSQGIMVMRESALFEYQPGQAFKTYPIPNGWTPVPLQRGDVAATRHLLLEKSTDAQPGKGSLDGLFQSMKRLTGVESADDYALMNLDTGHLTILAMDVGGKTVMRMSDCRRQNAVVNVCKSAQSYESLWDTDGSPNRQHYYWRVQWLNTPTGPVAVAHLRRTQEVRLFDLQSGKEVIAFRRPMGIASWSVRQSKTGQIAVGAQLAFTQHVAPDARALLDTGVDQRGQAGEGTIIAGVAETAAAPSGASAPAPL